MRLIDADAMRQEWLENGENEYVYDTNAVLASIDEQPTLDLESLRPNGQWIHVPLNMDPAYFAYKYNLRKKCSVCNYAMPEEYPNFKICPNCGAKMEG